MKLKVKEIEKIINDTHGDWKDMDESVYSHVECGGTFFYDIYLHKPTNKYYAFESSTYDDVWYTCIENMDDNEELEIEEFEQVKTITYERVK